MNQEQRAALRKLAEEATPGPWADDGWQHVGATYSDQVNGGHFVAECRGPNKRGNMLHIAANPSTILQLLDYIETLEKDAARYRWLRENNWFASGIIHDAPYGRRAHDSHEYLDAAIEAVMQGETE